MDLGQLVLAIVPIVVGYLIGGIPFGIIVARAVGGPDPRTLGSGRTGGANVARALGPRLALLAGLLDAAKGAVSVLFALFLTSEPLVAVLAALAAIIGHSRSPYIGLRGGRGVAPAWGALLVIQPVVALVCLPVFAAIVYLTRISSLASLATSLVAGVGLAIAVFALDMPQAYLVYAVAGTIVVWLFHIDNIQRLVAGEERRVDWRRGDATAANGRQPPDPGG